MAEKSRATPLPLWAALHSIKIYTEEPQGLLTGKRERARRPQDQDGERDPRETEKGKSQEQDKKRERREKGERKGKKGRKTEKGEKMDWGPLVREPWSVSRQALWAQTPTRVHMCAPTNPDTEQI